jgi:hypothetical protein
MESRGFRAFFDVLSSAVEALSRRVQNCSSILSRGVSREMRQQFWQPPYSRPAAAFTELAVAA